MLFNIIFYGTLSLILFDLLIMIYKIITLKKDSSVFEENFSRYNMYNYKQGQYSFNYSKQRIPCTFDISKDGFLDSIDYTDVIFLGGSSAFGVGSNGNGYNVSAFLKNKYGINIKNLSIPGWNIEQEVITIFKHYEKLKPKKIILFDGSNNLALGLPFDYHNYDIEISPYAYYQEKEFIKYFYNGKSDSIKMLSIRLLKTIFKHSILITLLYKTMKLGNFRETKVDKIEIDYDGISNIVVDNYIKWIEILASFCKSNNIELIVVTQPYFIYGKNAKELEYAKENFKVNTYFDKYMLMSLDKLEEKIKNIDNITYIPIFRLLSKQLDLNYFTDAVHMTTDGYEIVADYIYERMKNVKEDN